ncbi:amino acid/amide ABC transporter ATP-binding protein 1, HAAT family [Roseivivax lentus]|uniref:Amino acid/amide ABC transporter ATP-binding protein 1, HAAT family n=1 Tax=Roseivivax lentus TaxID=633194 RepID=A0A1N7PCB7_9RHOB|nr:ABC transporter ATP-binding protein [Roseivivax lentus]SIT08180.1 amino acid/amide ABC transporter ATP-binding protein 1, HAAT family [Roseivivax lentus]
MLTLENLSKHFGGVRAVDGVTLTIREGEIFGLIGPNGSGKSTTVNLITGLYTPTTGTVTLDGWDLTAMPQHARTSRGVARTFQNIRLFGNLTVAQNLWVAQNGHEQRREHFLSRWFKPGGEHGASVDELLQFSRLYSKRDVLAGNLSFGEMRRLEMARALASNPRVLLLDEPAAGASQEDGQLLAERIRAVRDRGVTVLLIEHMMELVMGITDRIAVLNFGQKIAEGTPREIQDDPQVRAAYLGSGHDEKMERASA